MTKFNAKQRNFIENAWNHGFSDRIIAKKLSVPYLVIYTYRRSLGLSVITVSENRYDTWIQLIEKGVSLEAIAEQYEVNPYSIKIMLWRAWFKNSHFVVTKTSANSPQMKAGFYFC